jgi:hypothetical protein
MALKLQAERLKLEQMTRQFQRLKGTELVLTGDDPIASSSTTDSCIGLKLVHV